MQLSLRASGAVEPTQGPAPFERLQVQRRKAAAVDDVEVRQIGNVDEALDPGRVDIQILKRSQRADPLWVHDRYVGKMQPLQAWHRVGKLRIEGRDSVARERRDRASFPAILAPIARSEVQVSQVAERVDRFRKPIQSEVPKIEKPRLRGVLGLDSLEGDLQACPCFRAHDRLPAVNRPLTPSCHNPRACAPRSHDPNRARRSRARFRIASCG